jgi:YD repeat-containing protein
LGRLTALTYPDGEVAAYTYNTQGGIETVNLQSAVSKQPSALSMAYDANGNIEFRGQEFRVMCPGILEVGSEGY